MKWLLCPTLYWWNNLQCKLDSYHLSSGPVTLTNYSQTLVDSLLACLGPEPQPIRPGPARQGNPWPTHNTNISGVPNEHCHMVRHKRRHRTLLPLSVVHRLESTHRLLMNAGGELTTFQIFSGRFCTFWHFGLDARQHEGFIPPGNRQRFMNGSALCAVV